MKRIILKIIVVLTILILLVIMALVNIMHNNKIGSENTYVGNTELKSTYKISEIKSISDFKTINNCVNTVLEYYKDNNTAAIKSILIDDYLSNYTNNSNQKINYEAEYMTKKVFKYDSNLSIKTYFVQGYILNKDNKTKKDYNVFLNIDYQNDTFEMAPLEHVYRDYIDCSNFDNIIIKNEKIKEEIKEIRKSEFNNVKISNGLRR